MAEVKFKYDDWDPKVDMPLFRPGSDLGYGVVHASVQVSKPPTTRQGRGRASGQAVEGVIGLLAGCLEWLRQYDMSAQEVQQAVERYMRNNRDTKDMKVRQTFERNRVPSDVNGRKERLNPKLQWNRRLDVEGKV